MHGTFHFLFSIFCFRWNKTKNINVSVISGADPGFLDRGSNLQRGVRFVVFQNFPMKNEIVCLKGGFERTP